MGRRATPTAARARRRLPGRHPGPRPGRQPRRRRRTLRPRTACRPIRYGHHVAGNGGITVSDLSSRRRSTPRAGRPGDALLRRRAGARTAGRCAAWASTQPLRSGGGRGVGLTIPAPHGSSGVYLLKRPQQPHDAARPVRGQRPAVGCRHARRAARRARRAAGALVAGPQPGRQRRRRRAGHARPRASRSACCRGFSGDGLPVNFAHGEANALLGLDHRHRRYDVTTDFALAAGVGPSLVELPRRAAGRRRALDHRRPRPQAARVRAPRRHARLARHRLADAPGLARRPQPPRRTRRARAQTDIFGARILPLVNRPVTLTKLTRPATSPLFIGTVGQFTGYRRYEPTASLGTQLSLAADAVDEGGRPGHRRRPLRPRPRDPRRPARLRRVAARQPPDLATLRPDMDAPVPLIICALLAGVTVLVPPVSRARARRRDARRRSRWPSRS